MSKKQRKVRLNFNTAKHDDNTAQRLMKDLREQQAASQAVAKRGIKVRWQRFKKEAAKLGNDPQKMLDALIDLRKDVALICKNAGLVVFGDQSTALIDDKIAQVKRSGLAPVNVIREYIPFGVERQPRMAEIVNHDELTMIEWVASHFAQKGFIGLVTDGNLLCGLYTGGELVPIAYFTNSVGVSRLPTRAELSRDLSGLHGGEELPPAPTDPSVN